jgi:hypothetical protein
VKDPTGNEISPRAVVAARPHVPAHQRASRECAHGQQHNDIRAAAASLPAEANPAGEGGRRALGFDRGREGRTHSAPPPSEPDGRISRIRLSG